MMLHDECLNLSLSNKTWSGLVFSGGKPVRDLAVVTALVTPTD